MTVFVRFGVYHKCIRKRKEVLTLSAVARRSEIVRILRCCKRTTMPRLAAELGVNIRTIQRDIMTLTVDEGYPINTEPGNGGGLYLSDYRHPHKKILSKEQIRVLEGLVREIDQYRASVLTGILKTYS